MPTRVKIKTIEEQTQKLKKENEESLMRALKTDNCPDCDNAIVPGEDCIVCLMNYSNMTSH